MIKGRGAMNKISKTIFCVGLLISTGCASTKGFPKRGESVETILTALNANYSTAQIFTDYTAAADQKTYRNQAVAARMMAIDIRFAEFQEKMFSQRSYLTVGGDTAKSVIGVAGTLTSAGQTSQILSGLASAFDVGSASVDNNIYQNQTQIAVMSMMLAERTKVKARIETRARTSIEDYSMASALSDLEGYYMAGSIPGALAAITSAAGKKMVEAERKIETTYEPDAGTIERAKIVTHLKTMLALLTDAQVSELLKTPPEIIGQKEWGRLNKFDITSLTIASLSVKKSRFALNQILGSLALSDIDGKVLAKWDKKIRELAK